MFVKMFRNVFGSSIKEVHKGGYRMLSTTMASIPKFDKLQESALKENCILIDEHDKPLGASSKRDCHLVNTEGRVKLHRAFSVFLFNSEGDLLIQRRSVHKVYVKKLYITGIFKMVNSFIFITDHFSRSLYKYLL